MTDPTRQPDEAAVQFMIVDFLAEILKFSESPLEMAQYLTRQLRELMGVHTVIMLHHGSGLPAGPHRIVAIEPPRAQTSLLVQGLVELVDLHPGPAALLLRPLVAPDLGAVMDRLRVTSLSLTPLHVGQLRVGTLFALDLLDLQRTEDLVRLLNALSPVFALILRNTLQFESQEAKVLSQAEEYRALLETNLDGYVLVSGSGALLDANDAYLRMTGYTRAELLAGHVSDLDAIETREEPTQHTKKMKEEGSDRFHSQHRRKDGTSFPVEVSTTYVPNQDQVIGFIRDLTDQEATETALRESEAHHRELMELLGEGVSIVDASETFIMANPEAERIFGVGPHALIGMNLGAFIEPDEWQRMQLRTTQRRQGQAETYEVGIRRLDGVPRTLQVTVTPRFDANGSFLGGLGVMRDITDEIKTKEALRLSQKMESLGILAGGLAHDMNNVLGAILGLATTHLELQPEGSRLHTTFATITKACLRGRNTVKSLLDFARKDMAGERTLAINTLVKEEAHLLERTIPANIRIELNLDPAAGTILGDPDALSLVLMNLCVNALDAMPEGGRLRLSSRNLPGDQVSLTIADTGSGMAKDVLERAFEPFFTTKAQGKGTGLGLALVYSTVQAHHGTMEIRSKPGQGTTVELWFPKAGTEDAAPEPNALAPMGSSLARNILLVDDDELIQSVVSGLLEALGHRVVIADSGEAALNRIDQGLRPDLVLLDMNMPGWGGFHTLPKLRSVLPAVPVILSTGRADQRAIDLTRDHPGVMILPKPFGFRELQAAVDAILAT